MGLRIDTSRMFWFYKPESGKNFGDWIGPLIYESRRGHSPVYTNDISDCASDVFFSCGSILHNITQDDRAIIWGSGAIENNSKFGKPKDIRSVRGPLSRDSCISQGYFCPEIYGDPGLILPRYYSPNAQVRKWKLGIVPHFVDLEDLSMIFKDRDNVKVIDVRREVKDVVDDIVGCEAVVATSLHGIVVSIAYGVPVLWATYSDKIIGGNFKFNDFYLGIGCEIVPRPFRLDKTVNTKVLFDKALDSPTLPKTFDCEDMLSQCPI